MTFVKTIVAVTAFAAVSAFAGPLDQGMVGGQLKSNVNIGNVNQKNKALLGAAIQELNIGSVNGGKALGNVELTVKMKDVNQDNSALLGYAKQEANIGSLK